MSGGQNRSSAVMQQRSEPRDRATARVSGGQFYFTGRPCVRGHVAERRVSDKKCLACNAIKCRERRLRNLDAAREKDRDRYRTDPARRSYQFEQATRWAKANPGKRNSIVKARRSFIKLATPRWLTDQDRSRIRAIYREAASYGPGVMEVDHIVPLRGRTVCGLHVPGNLQIIPASANRAKSNLHAE